jgi:S-methyl-1-thioxylulose 5-phosphate methylthiotransferase
MGLVRRKRGERDWEGVEAQAYSDPALAGVEKRELIGAPDGAPHWRLRHFHVLPGGCTARERHPHDHGVYVLAGRARVTLGDRVEEVGPGDVVYVPGHELHEFEALGKEGLDFICVAPPQSGSRRG